MEFQNLAAFVLLLGALVFVHELGHFLFAKAVGVKVLRFSIGFGPPLLSFTRGETEYRIAALPLGGYVKMPARFPARTRHRRTRHGATWRNRPGSGC